MNIKFSMLYISFFVLLLTGCVMETEIPDSPQNGEASPVTLSIDTRALGTGESQINTIRIIQVRRNIAGSIENNRFVANPGIPLVVTGVSGEYDIYVVANETDNGNELTALKNVTTLDELRQVILPYDVAQRTATNIPMMGKVENVTIGLPTTTGGNATIKIGGVDKGTTLSATVTRLAIHVDLTVKSKSFSDLASVSFTGLPDGISLFGNNYEPAAGKKQTVTIQANAFTDVIPATTGYISEKTKASIILPSYLFAPQTEASKAAKIEVSIQGKPVPFKTSIGHVAQPTATDKDYTLHPNSQYTLTALVAGDDLTIDSQVRNWDKALSDYPAGGGSFWKGQPQDTRVGLNGTDADATGTFTAILSPNGSDLTFKWYRVMQKSNTDFSLVTEEITTGIVNTDQTSSLTLKADGLEDACMVYCVASITAPDGRGDRLESNYATFMPVGDWTQAAGTYPDMQNWKAPQNAPLGSTCLLQDNRDNKVYRVKLMADGNWWMVQDLAYGDASAPDEYDNYSSSKLVTNKIKTGLYGVCKSSGIATGGYLYNSYAAIQLPQGTGADHNNGVALKTEFIQGLCPDGWHLPGNMDSKFNEEWKIMEDALKWNIEVSDDLMKMVYNDACHFNAYTLNETVNADFNPIKAVSFWGGYGSAVVSKVPTFISLGFSANNLDNGAVMDPQGALVIEDGLSIRCLRNFK